MDHQLQNLSNVIFVTIQNMEALVIYSILQLQQRELIVYSLEIVLTPLQDRPLTLKHLCFMTMIFQSGIYHIFDPLLRGNSFVYEW